VPRRTRNARTSRSPTWRSRARCRRRRLRSGGQKLKPLADTSDINRLKNLLLDRYANGKALRSGTPTFARSRRSRGPVFAQKVAELHAQGLVDQRAYHASQDKLYDYGRKYLAFTRQVGRCSRRVLLDGGSAGVPGQERRAGGRAAVVREDCVGEPDPGSAAAGGHGCRRKVVAGQHGVRQGAAWPAVGREGDGRVGEAEGARRRAEG
jgi:hypothetical protein